MTKVQLLLTIGIPSLLVVLSWFNNNVRFGQIDKRLDAHDKRFDELEQRFQRRFDEIELRFQKRLDEILAAGHKDALEIMRSMTSLHERVAVVEAKQNS